MRDEAQAVLSPCASGAISPNVALMQLCLAFDDEATARRALRHATQQATGRARERLSSVDALWRATPSAFDLVHAISTSVAENGEGCESPAEWAKAFDAAATISPEASGALYSLGRRDLLDAATAEVAATLRARGLLGYSRTALEIGCGAGRFLRALSAEVAHVVGLDISTVMLAKANDRCADLTNVRVIKGDGWRLSQFDDEIFDLVLAVDVFPYLVAAGEDVVSANMGESHRVLRLGGRFVIFNYSYRGLDDVDQNEVGVLAGRAGFRVLANGERHLRLWDGAMFDLERIP